MPRPGVGTAKHPRHSKSALSSQWGGGQRCVLTQHSHLLSAPWANGGAYRVPSGFRQEKPLAGALCLPAPVQFGVGEAIMTVIPGSADRWGRFGDRSKITLVRDGCGYSTTRNITLPNSSPALWRDSCNSGWRGWTWSFGQHYCSNCANHDRFQAPGTSGSEPC